MKIIDTAKDFDGIKLTVASPEDIRSWSFGEIQKPETINYRTGRSERGGLFDERIFGPEKDYECYCGKYRRIRYRGIICEKCGVEVTRSIVRRERMGHIDLVTPVAHIWFLRGIPSRMSTLLDISVSNLEKVIYFAGYIITDVHDDEKDRLIESLEHEFKTKVKQVADEETKDKLKELFVKTKSEIMDGIKQGNVLSEIEYHRYSLRYGSCFEARIGAEAIYDICKGLDLASIQIEIEAALAASKSKIKTEKYKKRLSLVNSMLQADIRPEWMFLTALPVIPPLMRPMVALEGARYATSDVNDLYRRVINRNNRLKKLSGIGAPEVILRNEKRIIQEAVDALIDNSIASRNSGGAVNQSQRRPLKSLADALKSKQGLFRQNLLGKRVDYSGRSVIVVGPTLKLDQCGLPKHMALELFRPFVISKLLERELAFNIRGANRLIEDGIPEVWAILEEVIEGKYVLLNRAPTLHRLGIQAFHPILIEGNAIQVHPLVCPAFNADFDGDQMAVYLPLSEEAQAEARDLIAADKNLLKPQDGHAIVSSKLLDIALGCYWMTRIIEDEKGEGNYFSSPNQAIAAYDFDALSMRAKVHVLPTDTPKYAEFEGKIFETTVGRLFFNSCLPDTFPYINEEVGSKKLSKIVDLVIDRYGMEAAPAVLDSIKSFGYKYVTKSGITWGIDNVQVPKEKPALVARGRKEEEEIITQYNEGFLSYDEKYRKVIEVWEGIKQELQDILPGTLDPKGSAYDMLSSGARGNMGQLSQMAGMKGLIVNTTGRTIDFPVIPSFKEGLSPIEYFTTTHGSRKGLADTALSTAKAGYLTRRLVDVAQDVMVTETNCKTKDYVLASAEDVSGIEIPLSRNVYGRILAEAVEKDGEVLFEKGHLVDKEDAQALEDAGIEKVAVRSPLTCGTIHGICQKCYGLDLGRGRLVSLGESVGVVAAQAIGEPGTQLTLRTFHGGGVAGGADITQGLPRIEEVFERRKTPKAQALVNQFTGIISEIILKDNERFVSVLPDKDVNNEAQEMTYEVPPKRTLIWKKGDTVEAGDLLTDGSANIIEIFEYAGKEAAQEYIINEINKVYELQGAPISRKHTEIIVRQMFSRVRITDAGDTAFSVADVVEHISFATENIRVKEEGGKIAKAETIVLGISEVSLTTQSWLAAASFQNTNKVLINNAVKGGIDWLRGLKENVIIGNLIPAGTGFRGDYDHMSKDEEEEETENVE
ncbi:MAG: DNA-directed RNA polymerase subunit beta' [Flavobacteriaceae bacterium]|jgi:DNA-directed RNA polymerase subunit beta'